MRKMLEGYRNLRLQTKFTIANLVITLIPILALSVFFCGKLYDMVVADTIRTEQTVSSRTTPLIGEIVDRVLAAHGTLRDLSFYQALFRNEGETPGDLLCMTPAADTFRKQVMRLIDGDLITDIRIYVDLPKEQALFSAPATQGLILPIKEAKGAYWYGIFEGNRGYRSLFCPSFYLSPKEVKNLGDLAYITKNSALYDGEFITCYTVVYYSKTFFTQLLADNLTSAGSVSYLINDRDNLVATSDEALVGIYHFDYNTVRDSFMSSNNFILKNVLGEDVYAGFYSIDKTDWFMVVVMPSSPIVNRSRWMMAQVVLVGGACICIAFLFATRLSRSITDRLSTVVRQMAQVRIAPPVALPPSDSRDEIGNLIDAYNYMTRVMNQLMEEQAKAAEDLRVAEFNSLQAQMNPHFLYNTMDMINWQARQGRMEEVSHAVQDLSRFYKLTLSRKEKITTIADEVEHVTIYVRLQNMRYNGAVNFVADIPDSLMECPIPRLTFQPVVENSILHGLLAKERKEGAIVLTGWREENTVVILISDDGVGIAPECLPGILSGNSGGKGNNIAVYNTHRRLQLLYGLDYGLTYRSSPGSGTEVEIRIPAQETEPGTGPKTPAARTYLPLVTVADKKRLSASCETVSPSTLLRYNKKLTKDTYEIHNLHQISGQLSKGEDIYILSHIVTEDFPAHTHDYYEMNYVCQGAVVNVIDGQELYVAAGDMVILNTQAVQSIRFCQPNTLLLNFCLHRPLFEKTLKGFYQSNTPLSTFFRGGQEGKPNNIFYPLAHSLKAQSIISSILQEYAGAGFHQTATLEGLFLILLDHLSRLEKFSYTGVDNRTLQALQYIRANCLSASVADMADVLGCAEEELTQRIRNHFGRDVEEIIREVRLNHALQLLAQPKLNIFEIAAGCGYANSNKFFEDFKAQFGIPPEEYRRQFI